MKEDVEKGKKAEHASEFDQVVPAGEPAQRCDTESDEQNKFRFAQRVLAGLAYISLGSGDQLTVAELGGQKTVWGPYRGRGYTFDCSLRRDGRTTLHLGGGRPLANAATLLCSPGVHRLFGQFSGLPAVVVAAGFAPWLLKRLGLGPFPDHAVGAQVEVAAPDITEVEVHFGDVAPGFFAWLVPAAPPMARVGLLSREKPGRYLKEWLKTLAAAGIIASADAPISHGAVPLRPLPRTSGERLLAVGDAAGQVKPTSGGGIYYGLLAADMAAATLHRALEDNDLSARRLAGYERAGRTTLPLTSSRPSAWKSSARPGWSRPR